MMDVFIGLHLFPFSDKYLSQLNPDSSNMPGDGISLGKLKDNYLSDDMSSREATPSRASASPRVMDMRIEASKKSTSSISALKELVSMSSKMHVLWFYEFFLHGIMRLNFSVHDGRS